MPVPMSRHIYSVAASLTWIGAGANVAPYLLDGHIIDYSCGQSTCRDAYLAMPVSKLSIVVLHGEDGCCKKIRRIARRGVTRLQLIARKRRSHSRQLNLRITFRSRRTQNGLIPEQVASRIT
ncbi:uncharacterized protein LOC105828310 [Monomorium pharaonis]|uniref:uncharacterized protein LOC105828310 n=1 Tax=Monomorium pharaonis TaxID=307658 RepID=UPI00174740C6|nr:uncharacterized protein LOC105828310 [Monomorium pharaonis]